MRHATMQATKRVQQDGGPAGGLRLLDTLSVGVRAMPDMARGAGPVLVLTAVMLACSSLLSDIRAGAAGAGAAVGALAGFGAVTRIGLWGLDGARARGLGPGGFQLRWLELRLLGATLLITLFMSIILSLLGLTALALFGASGLDAQAIEARDWARVGPVWKLILLAGVGLVVLAAPVVLMVRLCLYAQATAVWGRMASLGATGVTNGAMAPLLAGLALCAALPALWAVTSLAAGWTGAMPVAAALLIIVQTPMTAGFLGAAWRRLGSGTGAGR